MKNDSENQIKRIGIRVFILLGLLFVPFMHSAKALAQAPELSVTPGTDLDASGLQGGPFSPGTKTYTLSNTGASPLNYSVGITENGFALMEGASAAQAAAPASPDAKPSQDLSAKGLAQTEQSPERVIVKFKGNAAQSMANGVVQNSVETGLAAAGAAISKHMPHVGVTVLNVTNKGKALDKILDELNQLDFVEYAEPDYTQHADLTPNDPSFSSLWGLHNIGQSGGTVDADIDAPEAWDANTGNPAVVVAVIDTGVDYNHVDLAANIWSNPGEIPGNGIDDDGNGYVDDIHGIDAVNNDSDPMDDHNHGTHVSGTIGAVGNNGVGVVGVNWNVRILGCKFLSAGGSGSTSDAIECLDYILGLKNAGINVKLSNNSWGGGGFSQGLLDAIEANGAADILFMAAAGNSAVNTDVSPHYPSSYNSDSIISVASTDRNDGLSGFSNFGATTVDLGAPGSSILSTTIGNTYSTFNGTSMATPHVAGAAALIWAQQPGLSASGMKSLILNSVDPIASLSGKTVTGGRLNVNTALSCSPGNPTMLISSPSSGFAVPLSQSTVVAISLSDCGLAVTGATVTVTPTNGDAVFSLLDDGVAPDGTANDGTYTGSWFPGSAGSVTLDIAADDNGNAINGSVSGEAQANYIFNDQVTFNWIDATTGTNAGVAGDDTSVNIPIGFDFDFYGVSQSTVTVSSNGYLTFGGTGTVYTNSGIPNTAQPNNLIAPFWDDLNPGSGGAVYYLLEGTEPNRRLTIEWQGVPHYPNTGAVTFEVTLFEGTHSILFQYQDVDFGNAAYDNGASATVGIENNPANLGVQYSLNSSVISSQSAILFFLPLVTVVDHGGGTLAGGANTTVDVTLAQAVNNLSPGSYSQTLAFNNLTNGLGDTTRDVNLTVLGGAVRNDFDGDGDSDLLLVHDDGSIVSVLQENSVYQSHGLLLQVDPLQGWTVHATGDVNGDLKADIVLYNTTTGEIRTVWVDGTSVLNNLPTFTLDPGLGLELRGVGDFDGDGLAEMIVYHPTQGWTGIVFLSGGEYSSLIWAITIDEPNDWTLKEVADLTGDSKSDLVTYNTVTGEVRAVEMDGTTPVTEVTLFTLPPATGFTVEDTGDFNGDSKTDILAIQASSGALIPLLMDGLVYQSSFVPGNMPPGFGLVNAGLYGKDSKSDFLVFNDSNGEVDTFYQDGALVNLVTTVLNLGAASGWSLHNGNP